MKKFGLVLIATFVVLGMASNALAAKGVINLIHDNTSHAAIPYIAEKKGYYKAEGVNVKRRVTSPRALIDALIGGTADIISTRGSRVGQIAARGLDVVGIALNRYGNQNMVLVPVKDKTTKSVMDLKGKTVGAQMGTGTWATWMTYLSRIGLSDKDFKIRNTKTGSLPAAFETGALDAGLTWEPWGSIIVDKGLGRMVMGPKEYDDLLGYTSPVFLTSSWSYIKKENPDGAQRFMNAHVRAMRFLNRNRDESTKIVQEFWKSQGFDFDLKKVKSNLYRFMRWDRAMITHRDIKEVQDGVDVSVKKGKLPKRIDVTAHIDTQLVENAYFNLMK
jgi:ABC-type nitrate/sulfonate/bicarbonate transport system substrate-binding protein